MKILVTGAAGLIGSHLVDFLLDNGHTVIGVDDMSYGNIENLKYALSNKNFELKKTKVQFLNLWKEKFDIIYHLASMKKPANGIIKSSSVLQENYHMIEMVVSEAVKTGAFLIFTSTSDVYGNSQTFLESEAITIGPPTNERYSYALSKLYGEQFIFNEIQQSDLKGCVVRVFGCASWRSNKTWSGGHIPLFIDKALRGESIHIHGDGMQTRSISHALDIAYGLSKLIQHIDSVNGQIINLGTDEQTTVREVAEYILHKTNSKSELIFESRNVVFGNYNEILKRFANTEKAKQLIDFKVNHTTYQVIDQIIKEFSDENSSYYSR
jgi:UDP-glucose 4-epimerase